LLDKPKAREKYVHAALNKEWDTFYEQVDDFWKEFTDGQIIVYQTGL